VQGVLEEYRTQINAVDREIVALVNRRLQLVRDLKAYKDANGIAFVDPDRERQLFEDRARENDGPLTDEGLRTFYAELLALTKREVG
jgi:chorismate mutase/prephenate dehydratase